MPYYGLSFSQYIDHGNGNRLCRVIKLVNSDEPTIEQAQERLNSELKTFVELYNSYYQGTAWAANTAELKRLKAELKAATNDFKEDIEFLDETNAAKLRSDHEYVVNALNQSIAFEESEIVRIKADLHHLLHNPNLPPLAEGEEEDYWESCVRAKKQVEYPEWAKIPGFGRLSFSAILGDITQDDHRTPVKLETAKIIPLEEALPIFERQYPITY